MSNLYESTDHPVASSGLDVQQLARKLYATAVANTRSQEEADDDVLLGIRLGRRSQ